MHAAVAAGLSSSTKVIFELRVDDTPSAIELADAIVTANEVALLGFPASIVRLFSRPAAGDHTASMRVTTYYNTVYAASIDPGSLSANILIGEEQKPFVVSFLPMINN